MNFISKKFWIWQGRRKLNSDDLALKYTGIHFVGQLGTTRDLDRLYPLLSHQSQVIRNISSFSIKEIISRYKNESTIISKISESIHGLFTNSSLLIEKLAIIEVMGELNLQTRESWLGDLVSVSENDLQFVILRSLKGTKNVDILDAVMDASETTDLVLRKAALTTWYDGLQNQDIHSVLDYVTPRLHYLIRATYELQTDGLLMKQVLSFSEVVNLPSPKAYPDFIIRYLTELIGNWDYDPEANRSLYSIVVPSYFTFNDDKSDTERPYIIL
ncbi:MAG: hypothetical protein OEY49_05380 [Candidatus Heimdallarchaeota archaeon]|nr:hypothetical protein [Candidatus Heimdallarchaeota archaeon]